MEMMFELTSNQEDRGIETGEKTESKTLIT